MAYERKDIISRIKFLIQDGAGFMDTASLDTAIEAAVNIYSRDIPQIKINDFTGDGLAYSWAVPSDWQEEFSAVKAVEYPQGENPAEYLEDDEWTIYYDLVDNVKTLKFRLIDITPSATETIRLLYTAPHTVPAAGSVTIRDVDGEAFCHLTASLCLRALAAKHTQSSESTIGADSVDWSSKVQQYIDLAKEYESLYRNHLGKGDDQPVKAGSAIQDMDTRFAWGADFVFHPRKWR